MGSRKIVIVGGGFGGVAAARTARAILGPEHEVTLIDRNRRTYLCGGFPLLIAGEREARTLSRSLGLLANRGINYVQAEVTRIDTNAQTVSTSDGVHNRYDYLVLAPGAEYHWDAVPGSSEAYSFYSIDTARRLRRKLSGFQRGRIVIAVASLPYKCPPAPFEGAMVLDWLFKQRGLRDRVDIHVFTPEPAPLKIAGPEAIAKLTSQLARRGVHLHAGQSIQAAEAHGTRAAFLDGSTLKADILITVPAHRPSRLAAEAGLVGESGWVEVDAATLQTKMPNVFALGDVNFVPMATGMGIPKAGVFASGEGETVGRNIAADIMGGKPVRFAGEGYCFLATGGDSAALLEGRFLAAEKPAVRYRTSTARGMRRKERFESDWRRFRV